MASLAHLRWELRAIARPAVYGRRGTLPETALDRPPGGNANRGPAARRERKSRTGCRAGAHVADRWALRGPAAGRERMSRPARQLDQPETPIGGLAERRPG